MIKGLLLPILAALAVATLAFAQAEYGPTIPTPPEGGVLYHADTIDCNPEDFDVEDPHFYVVLGYIWEHEDPPSYAAIFYRNDSIEEYAFENPDAMFYGSDDDPTIFVRTGESVERIEGFEKFMERYPASVCDIRGEEI